MPRFYLAAVEKNRQILCQARSHGEKSVSKYSTIKRLRWLRNKVWVRLTPRFRFFSTAARKNLGVEGLGMRLHRHRSEQATGTSVLLCTMYTYMYSYYSNTCHKLSPVLSKQQWQQMLSFMVYNFSIYMKA